MALYSKMTRIFQDASSIIPKNFNRLTQPQVIDITTQTSGRFGQIVKSKIQFVCFTKQQFQNLFNNFFVLGSKAFIQFG